MEFELVKQLLPNIPVMAVNQVAATILTPENQVIVIDQPKKMVLLPLQRKKCSLHLKMLSMPNMRLM